MRQGIGVQFPDKVSCPLRTGMLGSRRAANCGFPHRFSRSDMCALGFAGMFAPRAAFPKIAGRPCWFRWGKSWK